ncbi:sensor histidine kinase [Dongia rigui]|uniref:histidine kinase n=1 Tax=Dongia rigui TaxID=940149 RepID=A0ABU5DZS6_9PROT|nr:ATP-binding protein [Dongia rigui]MDY0872698.1 ATP-binding protein [Dongia rigui]
MMRSDNSCLLSEPATILMTQPTEKQKVTQAQAQAQAQAGLPSWLISWPTALLAAVLVFAIAAILLAQDYGNVLDAGRQRAQSLAEIAAAHLQQTLSAVEVSMQVLDRPPAALTAAGSEPALGPILARVMRIMPALSDMQVVDVDGRAIVKSEQGVAKGGMNAMAFAYHRDHPGDTIRLDWQGPTTADLLISRRISNGDGSFGGVTLGRLDPTYFADFFVALGADRATLRLADGTVLVNFGRADIADSLTAVESLHGLPLAVEIGLDREQLLASWYSKRDVGMALAASLTLLLFGGVIFLRRHLAQITDLAALSSHAAAESAARSRADEISRRKSDFVSQMSHELRTPLNAILGFSEVIKSASFGPVGQPKYQEYADDIHYSAQHLLAVINNILDLSKVEAGKWQMMEDQVTLDELFDALRRLASERAARENVELSIKDLPANMILRGDKRTLVQIMLNLTINAIKFAGPDRQVDLEVQAQSDGSLAIAVADHGEGMTKDELVRAMRPFDAPMHGAKGKKQDTGLGLPLAAAFAELHGGRVELDSMPGLGTTARLILPAERVQSVH